MLKKIGYLLVVMVITVPGLALLRAEDKVGSEKTTSVFKVEGMTCGGCEAGVRLSVTKLDGVEKVEASYEKGRATVTYDAAKVTPEEIVAAIEGLGYKAVLEKPADTDEKKD
jgi:copper ion binding protein